MRKSRQKPPQGASEASWVTLEEWKGGSERRRTEKFVVPSRQWRVSWKALAGDPIGTLTIYVRNGKDEVVAMALNLQGGPDRTGIAPGSIAVTSEPGEHYLEIESAGVSWLVVAEQQR
jgi:hypothetical protein